MTVFQCTKWEYSNSVISMSAQSGVYFIARVEKCGHLIIFQYYNLYIIIYILVPKGAQEKRTEVLENKVDRM